MKANKIWSIIPSAAWVLILTAIIFTTPTLSFAQDTTAGKPTAGKVTLSGFLKDKSNGENLFGAAVYVKELGKGAAANEYGFYSITMPAGKYTVVYSYIGFETQQKQLNLDKSLRVNVDMASTSHVTDEVVIEGERKDKNVESTNMGRVELKTEDIKSLPALLGEVDVMRTLQLLPGVMSAGEGNSGFYVRGGGPDQNLVLLDGAVVYNTGHLLGFFSVFNSDAISNTTLIKGGMPANYGGRVSSVIDVQMKEGNNQKYQVEGGIGLISSRLTIQGPIQKKKSSFIISGRRTYIDLLTKPFLNRYQGGKYSGNGYYFYDLNVKVNYQFSDKDRIYASGYFGRDVFNFQDPAGTFNASIPWGNSTATLRWNHLFSPKTFMNLTAIFNDYNFGLSSNFQGVKFALSSGVRDIGANWDFDFFPSANHSIKYGATYTYHIFTPYTITGDAGGGGFETDKNNKKFGHETAIYILDDWTISKRWKMNFGVRASLFNNTGPQHKVIYDGTTAIDTVYYKVGQNIKTYWGIEPRVNVRFKINEESSIKASATLNNQYIHLVSASSSTLPTDLWIPSTPYVKPQLVLQYSIGYFQNFHKNMFETSVELYFKNMYHQIEFGEKYAGNLNTDIEDGFVFGKGYSYGAEFFFKKAIGDLTSWVGYTLAQTRRIFPDINEGKSFPAKYDRTHDLSVVVQYAYYNKAKSNPRFKWKFSAIFVYGTGQGSTVPIGRYLIEGKLLNEYGARNGYRLAPYHRLDIGATMILARRKHYSDVTFSIYNLYSRMNPYFIYYDIKGSTTTGDLKITAKQVSLFPILPSITWNFKF